MWLTVQNTPPEFPSTEFALRKSFPNIPTKAAFLNVPNTPHNMAEAVAGLSLAANILQMVEYGVVFVRTARNIHSDRTDTDVVKDFKQLQYLAKDVEKVLESLDQDIPAASSESGGDLELGSIAEECRKVTAEILEFVGKTGEQKSWKTRMHKTVKEAFQLTWGQGKLAKLQTRLDSMRSQLTLRLVHSLRCVCRYGT